MDIKKAKLKAGTRKKYSYKRRFYGNRYTKEKQCSPAIVSDNETLAHADDNDVPRTSQVSEPTESTAVEDKSGELYNKDIPMNSISFSKVESISFEESINNDYHDGISGYRLVEMSILSNIFKSFACPECYHCELVLQEQKSKKKGFSSYLSVVCSNCNYSRHFNTSKTAGVNGGYDINRRMVYAMRSCGVGYHGLEKVAVYACFYD